VSTSGSAGRGIQLICFVYFGCFVYAAGRHSAGRSLTYADVVMDESLTAVKLRREMERDFAPAASKIAAQYIVLFFCDTSPCSARGGQCSSGA